MKVAFDEHIPPFMIRVLTTLAKERQFQKLVGNVTLVSAKDYAPNPPDADYIKKSDVPWLDRFSADGGKAVISGDVDMRFDAHEQQALISHGFIVIFFERRWADWSFFRKSSLLLHYWPTVAKKLKRGKRGKFWVIPSHWREDGKLRDVSPGKKQISKTNPEAAGRAVQGAGPRTGKRPKRKSVREQAAADRKAAARATAEAREPRLSLPDPPARAPKAPAPDKDE